MLDRFFTDQETLLRLREGSLGLYLDDFAGHLAELGYTWNTGRTRLGLLGHLARWLRDNQLIAESLDEAVVGAFVLSRTATGLRCGTRDGRRATLTDFLEFLRGKAVISVPDVKPCDDSPASRLKRDFQAYLVSERGLSRASLLNTLPYVERFLSETFPDETLHLEELRPANVTQFILRHARSAGPGRAKLMVGAIRSFLRFLHVKGHIQHNLTGSVPTVADWRLSSLPKSLEPEQVAVLLNSCDRHTPAGKRDYAILLLLARLGLRACEIVSMKLGDIDWEAGVLTVRGKGKREDRIPLPHDVGTALAAYLRDARPRGALRRVFVCKRAPLRGIGSSTTISTLVRRALDRAQISSPRRGAHLLRHSLAREMLRKGASLREIGELLRHRLVDTTAIYAKVNLGELQTLAQPWLGGDV